MVDIFTKEKRSEVMGRIHSKNTSPEIRVRKYLHSHGFRYRLYKNNMPGKPDLVLAKYKTVVFVNGCFWHGHDCKIGSGSRKPQANSEYWEGKIDNNMQRDKYNHIKLGDIGWNVIVIWECQTLSEDSLYKALISLYR